MSSLADVKHHPKDRLQTGCVLRSKRRPDVTPNRPHQLCWHTIIPLKLKFYGWKGAYLQMGNQLDFDIGSHGKLLDSYTRATLVSETISLFLPTQPGR